MGNSNWYQDEIFLNELFDYACANLLDKDKQSIKDKCMRILARGNHLKDDLILVLRAFPTDPSTTKIGIMQLNVSSKSCMTVKYWKQIY